MKSFYFPIDHFGLAASKPLSSLISFTGDKRKRKAARKALINIAKYSDQIPTQIIENTITTGLIVDTAGQLFIVFQVVDPNVDEAFTHGT